MALMKSSESRRQDICRSVGLKDEAAAFRLIAAAAKEGPENLVKKGLDSSKLNELGYSLVGMKKLGFSQAALEALGYLPKTQTPQPVEDVNEVDMLRQMIQAGARLGDFQVKGYTVHHLKRAGIPIGDLERAGYQLDDFIMTFSAAELRRAGYGIRELRRFFQGHDLRSAGFDATDMRNAGYAIKDLLRFGYNENQVRTAGYSVNDLSREGLTKQTVDRTRSH